MDLRNMRQEYNWGQMEEEQLPSSPWTLFDEWMKNALNNQVIPEPYAMALSTVSPQGKPSSRIVLLKEYDHKAFVFFTRYTSRKGSDLKENPHASLLFFWPQQEQQIRIEGRVSKTSTKESNNYFLSRPVESQAASVASKQSRILSSREALISSFNKIVSQSGMMKRPTDWGGYRLFPAYFEFWQGGVHRLHDRIAYTKKGSRWEKSRLYP